MKTLLLLAFILLGQFASAQGPIDETSKMKSCLAEIYTKQILYQDKFGVYAKKAKKLGLNTSEDCKGIKLTFKNISKDSFFVQAKFGKLVWSIDDTKTMNQIK
jgi:hypothetical protein